MLFCSPLRVYTDVNLQDDRASLAELHEYLNAADAFTASPTTAEAEFDLASNAAVARARHTHARPGAARSHFAGGTVVSTS